MSDLKHQVLQGAEALHRKSSFDPAERAQWLNASEADSCIRQQWYTKHFHEESQDQDWGYAWRGHYVEKWVVDSLRETNQDIRFIGDEQLRDIKDPENRIAATPDGVWVVHEEEKLVYLEIKSAMPSAYLPKKSHITQVQLGMEVLDYNLDLVDLPDWEISHAIIIYINPSKFNEISEHRVERDPDILDKYAKRANRILNAKSPLRLSREGKATKNQWECNYCPFTERCGVDKVKVDDDAAESGSSVAKAVTSYAEIRTQESDLKTRKAKAAATLKEYLDARNGKAFEAEGFKISYQTRKGTTKLDRARLEEETGIKVSDYETVGPATKALQVK